MARCERAVFSSATAQLPTHVVGNKVYYRPADGVFTVTATLTDTPAGLEQVVFPTTTSAGAVYALNGALTATVNHGYIFTPSSTESGLNFPVTASDRAGNVVTHTFDVERDATAPAVTVNAPSRIYSSTIPVSWTVAELGSGPTGVYTVSVMTDTGPLQMWLAGTSATSGNFIGTLGHKYTFVVTTTDNVNNIGQGTAETVATQVTKYYYIGSTRVAMRQGDAVTYLHTDHLGTVSIATSGNGQFIARTLNLPYGGVRWTDGTMPTDWGYTGQREPVGTGLVYLHARFYAPFAGRFVSADTIVPGVGKPQTLNRFSYVNNSPLRYTDPSGHCIPSEDGKKCLPEQRHGFTFVKLPVKGQDLDWTQWYGTTEFAYDNRDLYEYSQGLHAGIDLGGAAGTEVRAGVYGKVISINRAGFRPANVTIEVKGFQSVYHVIYGHLAEDSIDVELEAEVTPDTLIGTLEDTEDHTHLEIRSEDGTYIFNPLRFMYEKDQQTLQRVAFSQLEREFAVNEVTYHVPTEEEDHQAYYGNPLRQPLVVHWGESYWEQD